MSYRCLAYKLILSYNQQCKEKASLAVLVPQSFLSKEDGTCKKGDKKLIVLKKKSNSIAITKVVV